MKGGEGQLALSSQGQHLGRCKIITVPSRGSVLKPIAFPGLYNSHEGHFLVAPYSPCPRTPPVQPVFLDPSGATCVCENREGQCTMQMGEVQYGGCWLTSWWGIPGNSWVPGLQNCTAQCRGEPWSDAQYGGNGVVRRIHWTTYIVLHTVVYH